MSKRRLCLWRQQRPMAIKSMRDTLGGKGANLAEMSQALEFPFLPGFTVATQVCNIYFEGRQ